MRIAVRPVWFVALVLASWPLHAGEALVAVAANFAVTAAELAKSFEQASEHRVVLTPGSTGKLYAQIVNGAPFDVLLAADQESPRRLEASGFAVVGTRRSYAVGRLVLWSPDPHRLAGDGAAVLRGGDFRSLAIANPRLAPYGRAAVQTLEALDVYRDLRGRIVMGENVAQAQAMVASGNAELGLVALSSVVEPGRPRAGSSWTVPEALHAPIRQDGVLLMRGAQNPAAVAFLDFLNSSRARTIITGDGYDLE